MVAVDLQWIKGTNPFADIVSTNGTSLGPFPGGKIFFRDAGSSNPRIMYQDKDGSSPLPLTDGALLLDANGRLPVSVYKPIGAWKFIFQNSLGVEQITEDQLPGALDTSPFTQDYNIPSTPVINKATDYVILTTDRGKVINANPTGGTIVQTLPSATVAGDGWRITIRHVGTANQVTIAAVSGQTVNGATSRSLVGQYESLCLVSDGANWHIDGHAQGINYGQVPFFYVESRTLTTPPASPTPGARYIIAASGTPTGLWTGMSNGDIMESNGQGGWIRLVPVEGWHAYDRNANQMCFFLTAWVGLPATDSPPASNLKTMVLQNTATSGTGGGTATAGWSKRTLNTERLNTITGASVASSQITLPTGRYRFTGTQTFLQTNSTRTRVVSTTDSAKKITSTGTNLSSANADRGISTVLGELEVTAATEIFEFQYLVSNQPANSLGEALGAEEEIFATLVIEDVASLQGSQGDDGPQGPQGFAGFKYQYSNSTTVPADPGTGFIRFNNLTLSSITAASVDATSAETGNPDVSDEIAAWVDNGILKMAKVGAEQNWVTFNVTNSVDNGGYLDLTLVYRDHAGSFSNTDSVSLQFTPKGTQGVTGTTIPALDYDFNTATAGDPGSGKLLFNNVTLSSATTMSVSDNDRLAPPVDRSADIGTWDDNGASSNRGYIYLINAVTGARVATFKATGSITDNVTYQTMSVTYVAGTAPANNTRVAVIFVPAGATGAGSGDVVGPASAGDGNLTLFNGTTGKLIKDGGVVTAFAKTILDDTTSNAALTTLTATRAEAGAAAVSVLTKLRESMSVADFGAVADGTKVASGCGITSADATLNAPASTFTSADVGKRIAVAGAGAAGVDLVTTIASFTSATEVELTAAAGTTVANVAIMFGTDNATAINAAIAAAKLTGRDVYIPAGTYVHSRINFNSAIGVHLRGAGKQSGSGPTNYGTHLWPLIASGGGIAIDWAGSTHCSISQLQIGRSDLLGLPSVGLLVAAKTGSESTHLDLEDVFIIGTFATSALYKYGVPDCEYHRCQFYNYRNNGSASAVVVTGTNIRSITSPNETVNTGLIDTSNTHFTNSHIIERGNTAAQSLSTALFLDSVSNVGFERCNMISSLRQVGIADQNGGSEALVFNQTIFGAGYTTDPSYNIKIDTTLTIKGLALIDCIYNDDGATGTGGPTDAVLNIPSGGRVDGLRIMGDGTDGAKIINGGGTTAVHGSNWYIETGGMQIDLPGSIQGLILVNPGTIVTVAGSSFTMTGNFEEHTIALSDETTAITTGTGKASMSLRYAFKLVGVRGSLNTVSSSGTPTFDMNEAGVSVLSTKVTIDASELSSDTAATPAVISDSVIAANALLTFDIDVAGTGAKGAKMTFWGFRQ